MALSEAQTFGYSDNTQELLEKARDILEKGGMDVDAVLAPLRELHAKALAANAEQEEAKRNQKKSTEKFLKLKHELYLATSSALDMAIGSVGKGSVAAKNFQRLRSDIQRANTSEEIAEVSVEVPTVTKD